MKNFLLRSLLIEPFFQKESFGNPKGYVSGLIAEWVLVSSEVRSRFKKSFNKD